MLFEGESDILHMKSLLQDGMAIDLITRVTGWSIAEVNQLKQESRL